MKKLISVLIVVFTFLAFTVPVAASDAVCVSKETFAITSELDELIQIALESNKSLSSSIENDKLEVSQLSERRTFSDGSIEEDWVKSEINLYDNDLRSLDINNSFSNALTDYGIAVTVTLYFTDRMPDIYSYHVYRINKVTGNIYTPVANKVTPSSLELIYSVFTNGNDVVHRGFYTCNLSSSQTYTLNSIHSGFYPATNTILSGIAAEAYLNCSNGGNINVFTGIADR